MCYMRMHSILQHPCHLLNPSNTQHANEFILFGLTIKSIPNSHAAEENTIKTDSEEVSAGKEAVAGPLIDTY